MGTLISASIQQISDPQYALFKNSLYTGTHSPGPEGTPLNDPNVNYTNRYVTRGAVEN